jgi:hypothetical protein
MYRECHVVALNMNREGDYCGFLSLSLLRKREKKPLLPRTE